MPAARREGGAAGRSGGEGVPQGGELLRDDAVEDPTGARLKGQQAGRVQHLQVVRPRGLGQPEGLDLLAVPP